MIPINHQNNTILSKSNRISDRSKIGIMLIIEITKLELTGGHIRNMLIKETSKSELTTAILDYQNEIGSMISTKIKYWQISYL